MLIDFTKCWFEEDFRYLKQFGRSLTFLDKEYYFSFGKTMTSADRHDNAMRSIGANAETFPEGLGNFEKVRNAVTVN